MFITNEDNNVLNQRPYGRVSAIAQGRYTMSNSKAKRGSLSGDHFTLKQVAEECIGFQTLSEDLKDKKGTLSDHFMDAAKVYIKKPKKGETMEEDHAFLVACAAQEKASKSESAGRFQWDKVPPSWSQMKSNLKAAFNMGIDINKYETESSLRKDLNEARKAQKEANKTPEEKAKEQLEGAVDDMVENGETTISQRIFAIIEACKSLTPEQVDDAAAVLASTLEDIKVLNALNTEVKQKEDKAQAA